MPTKRELINTGTDKRYVRRNSSGRETQAMTNKASPRITTSCTHTSISASAR